MMREGEILIKKLVNVQTEEILTGFRMLIWSCIGGNISGGGILKTKEDGFCSTLLIKHRVTKRMKNINLK